MRKISTHPLPPAVQLPAYDRQQLKTRIVHIGFGAFHRAHQALMTDRVLNRLGGDWGICEVSLFGRDTLVRALREQDHLFSVLEKGAQGHQSIIVGAVRESMHGRIEGIEAIVEKLAEPQVAIVSLTITEKGYCIEPVSGKLDMRHPDIQRDLQGDAPPATAPGLLVAALSLRHQRGLPGFSVLSCDNIPENGHVVKNAIIGLADAKDPALARWIDHAVTFPSTMVDRIVPALTPEFESEIRASLGGIDDPCGIAAEPFLQWVIEDNFVAGRPAWEQVGAQLVNDVLPFEQMKLRMLNGSHSFLAYLGYLAGYEFINSCMEDENYRRAAYQLMLDEQAPTLSVTGINLTHYADSLIDRYRNPALKHRTWQIAMDGTQKLPQRLLDSLRWHGLHGGDYRWLALAVAAWMRYIGGVDDRGQPIEIKDPMAEKLGEIVENTADGEERVRALLGLKSVFGETLPANTAVVEAILRAYHSLQRDGAKATVAGTLTSR
ncbi:mannitol dehydrogenase family protein [Rouxiella chamberiensis]|uniref:mannitol dehydrogenase family protein n=1 Tax=Rouxiella chamberiensis TaxID=1513468 RepID=UPI0005D308E1|nr:fructuronate reductase [Rouxiella chamberiensis]